MKFCQAFVVALFVNDIQAIKIGDDDNGLNLPAIVNEHDEYIDKQILAQA